jgi:hypothetical protein
MSDRPLLQTLTDNASDCHIITAHHRPFTEHTGYAPAAILQAAAKEAPTATNNYLQSKLPS